MINEQYRLEDIKQAYLGGRKITSFHVFKQIENSRNYYFLENNFIYGHHKDEDKILGYYFDKKIMEGFF